MLELPQERQAAEPAKARIFFCGEKINRCPNPSCRANHQPHTVRFIRRGHFTTRWNHQPVRCYRCPLCGRGFCSHTFRPHYRQHRPDLNDAVFQLYASGLTQRRMAIVLGVNRKTIVRKIRFLASLARQHHDTQLQEGRYRWAQVQFDEMETFEHTKLKPVTIAVAVHARDGRIIDLRAAPLAYKGPLAQLAYRKYGPRPNRAHVARRQTLLSVALTSLPGLVITTDSHPAYPRTISTLLSHATHRPTLRRMPELVYGRRNPHDPLFTLNYTAAKIRNDLSRMARKTWVTTKNIPGLQAHLDLYLAWNNRYLIAH